jgi:HEAT repeat protein
MAHRYFSVMDQSVTIARHFARLVWLLLRDPGNVDEQKAQLRAIVTLAKDGGAALGVGAGFITASGTPLATALSGVPELAERMSAHAVATIAVDARASAADLLGAARVLAAAPGTGASSAPGATVRFVARGALPDLDFGEVLDDPLASAQRTATPRPSAPRKASAPAPAAIPASPAELLERLDTETNPDKLVAVLDDLAVAAEDAARDGKSVLASDVFHHIVLREREIQEFEVKRAFVFTVKRLSRPPLLRAVLTELASAPERRDDYLAVLARAGEEGAEALIEQLTSGSAHEERSVYFDALSRLQAGVPTLIHMLGDPRWHVARNAAALLGELQAVDAERPLGDLLHHDDERVRHAATISLMRLGTSKAMQTIQEAFKDKAPQVRMQAAAALVTRKDVRTAALLLRALDDEKDDEVAAAFLIALGRLATGDAVDRLIATAEADRGLFRKKPVALRVAAVQGLAEARTPEAMATLKALQADKDEDVQATAVYALGRTTRSARR